MVNIRILKLQMYIPHEKYSTHIFSCLSQAPFRSYVPLKTKFENLVCKKSHKVLRYKVVCKISQKVLMLEPSNLVHWLGPRSR